MEKRMLAVSVLAVMLSCPSSASQMLEPGDRPSYVIVTDANDQSGRDSYATAVEELTALRNAATVLNLNDASLEDVFSRLRVVKPRYVAFVVHPEKIEDNFVGTVFQGMTELNDDPYLDCAYGYITGATPEDALGLVRNTAAVQRQPDSVPKRFAAIAHTFAGNDLAPFATQQANHFRMRGYETAEINPIDNSAAWDGKADRELRKLDGASLVFLAGHGMGDMSCAIAGDAFGRRRLKSAIVINGTCHSAATCVRHDSADQFWTIKTTRIGLEKSVCLNFIKAGAIGQIASTASSSWSNVALSVPRFFDEGHSMGEALQESLNERIRAAGVGRIRIVAFVDGRRSPQALAQQENPGAIQSLSRVVLVGDPAYRPFPNAATAHPHASPPKDVSSSRPEERSVRQLITELSDPHAPRFRALGEIVKIGKPAVPPLIEEMKTSNNWQIPKALGAIGDERAIGPLIEKLGECRLPPVPDVVAEALHLITGRDFGADAEAWRAWWRQKSDPGSEPKP